MCFGACEQAHRQGKGSEFVAGVPIAPKIPIFWSERVGGVLLNHEQAQSSLCYRLCVLGLGSFSSWWGINEKHNSLCNRRPNTHQRWWSLLPWPLCKQGHSGLLSHSCKAGQPAWPCWKPNAVYMQCCPPPPGWINYRSSNKKEGVGVLKQASWLQEGDRRFAMKSRPKERAAPCWTLLFPIHLISLSKSPASPTPYLFSSFTTSPPSPSNSPYGCLSRSVTSL